LLVVLVFDVEEEGVEGVYGVYLVWWVVADGCGVER